MNLRFSVVQFGFVHLSCVFCFSDVLIYGNWSDAAALLRHYEHYFFLEKHVCAIAHREIISIFLTYLS